jgi:hypothetical protein
MKGAREPAITSRSIMASLSVCETNVVPTGG